MRKLHHLSATALLLIGCGPVAGGWATSLSGLDSDRNVILSIFGQSLGNGGQGFGPVDTTQYGSNERYVLGSGFRPLVEDCDGEGVCSGPSMGTLVESPLSPIANQFRYVTGRDPPIEPERTGSGFAGKKSAANVGPDQPHHLEHTSPKRTTISPCLRSCAKKTGSSWRKHDPGRKAKETSRSAKIS